MEATLTDQERVLAALETLDDRGKEIVTLKFFSGMTNRVIATLTGLTESNVGVILYRSVRKMRDHFKEVNRDDQ